MGSSGKFSFSCIGFSLPVFSGPLSAIKICFERKEIFPLTQDYEIKTRASISLKPLIDRWRQHKSF